jgi:FG-GAP-like repeat/Putative Ig domain/FG-GAP repeat
MSGVPGRIAAGLVVCLSFFAVSCGSSGPVTLTLSPSPAQTDYGVPITITANLMPSTARGVKWTLSGMGGLVGPTPTSVTYLPPAPPQGPFTSFTATVTATDLDDARVTANCTITTNPPPQITTQSLLPGSTNTPYNSSLTVSGGSPPFTWSLEQGVVPVGLTLGPSSGAITGTPTAGGTWYFWVHLVDAAGEASDAPFLSLTINSDLPPGNPVPFLSQPLVPDAAAPAGPSFTLTANGAGFLSSSAINFNGSPLTTTFVSGTRLTAVVPAPDIASAGTAEITVVNPSPGGGASNVVLFPVAAPEASPNFENATGSPIHVNYLPFAVAAGDLRTNGKTDLVTGSYGGYINVLLGNGDGTFSQAPGSPFGLPKPPWDNLATSLIPTIGLADFTHTGKLGMVALDSPNLNANLLLGNGDGTFSLPPFLNYTWGGESTSLGIADFNADGNLDLSTGNFTGIAAPILLGYSAGTFNLVQQTLPVNNSANYVVTGDFNGDGKLDIAVSATLVRQVYVFLGNGDGTFNSAPGSPITVAAPPFAIAVADFNGDSKPDLAVANDNGTVDILLGKGDGSFTEAPGSPITAGANFYAVAAADFTGNGKTDLALSDTGNNTVVVLLGNGDGTFTPAPSSPISLSGEPFDLAVGDFNSSGRLGLAVVNGEYNLSVLVQH